MARNSRSAPADAGDPTQREDTGRRSGSEEGARDAQPDAAHDGSDGTIPVGGTSVADRDNVDAERLIREANDAADLSGAGADEPRSEADFGGSGNMKSLKTAGSYMIMDPTTGVEVTQDAREVEMSAFLQGKIDDGLIVEG